MLVDDEDLPSPRGAHRADRLQELCGSGSCMSCMRGLLAPCRGTGELDALDLTVLISDIFVRYSEETEADEVVSDDDER